MRQSFSSSDVPLPPPCMTKRLLRGPLDKHATNAPRKGKSSPRLWEGLFKNDSHRINPPNCTLPSFWRPPHSKVLITDMDMSSNFILTHLWTCEVYVEDRKYFDTLIWPLQKEYHYPISIPTLQSVSANVPRNLDRPSTTSDISSLHSQARTAESPHGRFNNGFSLIPLTQQRRHHPKKTNEESEEAIFVSVSRDPRRQIGGVFYSLDVGWLSSRKFPLLSAKSRIVWDHRGRKEGRKEVGGRERERERGRQKARPAKMTGITF